MENENKIRLMGVRPHKSFERLIDRRIEKWISREKSLLFLPKDSDYSVLIRRESDHFYLCQIQIQIGPRYWEGYANEKTPELSFQQAIKRLKYVRAPTSPSAPAYQTLGSVA